MLRPLAARCIFELAGGCGISNKPLSYFQSTFRALALVSQIATEAKVGGVMGFLRRLLGRPDPVDELMSSIARNATLISAPTDHALMKLAEERKGHISLKAVSDEYNRLILEKYGRR